MPRMRDAIRSGWNHSSWSSFSPVDASLIGLPVTAFTESAAPPRASPSSFVRTTPSNAIRSWNACATFTASWPVIASSTSSTLCGFASSRTRASSSISASSTCRRPAVSTITTSRSSLARAREPVAHGLDRIAALVRVDGDAICLPSCSSCSIAAGRWRSAATSAGLPSLLAQQQRELRRGRRLARALEAGEQDHRRRPAGEREPRARPSPSAPSAPRGRSSRPAGRASGSSAPPRRSRARARVSTNSLTTWKLTSASSSARRISRIARETASSSSVPRLRRSLAKVAERALEPVGECVEHAAVQTTLARSRESASHVRRDKTVAGSPGFATRREVAAAIEAARVACRSHAELGRGRRTEAATCRRTGVSFFSADRCAAPSARNRESV